MNTQTIVVSASELKQKQNIIIVGFGTTNMVTMNRSMNGPSLLEGIAPSIVFYIDVCAWFNVV